MGAYDYGFAGIVVMLLIKELFNLVKWALNKRNGANNPHATTEYVHDAITDRTKEMKGDIKTLEKKVNKIDKDVGILIARDPKLRSRAND